MGKFTEDDEEDDEAWDPGVSLVCVHDLVPEQGNQEGGRSNN